MERFIRLVISLSNTGGYIATILVFFLIVMIVVHVFARRVLGTPLLWGEEVSTYLLLGSVFFALAYTLKEGGHVRVDLILGRVSGRMKVVLEKLCTLLAVFFALIFFIGNFLMFKQFYVRHARSNLDLQLPLVIPGIALLLGSLLLVLQLLAQLFTSDKRGTQLKTEDQGSQTVKSPL